MPIDDTGWKKPVMSIQDGLPTGTITPGTGIEEHPCFMCKSFEKDNRRLMQHLNSKGLVADENGCYETPIAQDFRGRRSLKIDPRDFGYCRKNCIVTSMNATCPDFQLVQFRGDLIPKIG